ncbi:MAG: hypothetical protein R3F37_03225 [Candidatus Competibacteraceae bacterium]
MIALPVRNTPETAVVSAAAWLARRNEDHPLSLSREQLGDLLKHTGLLS